MKQQAWAISAEGKIYGYTSKPTKKECIDDFLSIWKQWYQKTITWKEVKKAGYHCIKVTIKDGWESNKDMEGGE
jgi:hypothetical protein